MDKKIIPIFKLSNGKQLLGVNNPAVASNLLKKKDYQGNPVYTEKKSEADEAMKADKARIEAKIKAAKSAK